MKTSISSKTTLALLCAGSALLLQACGGGGGGSDDAAAAPPPAAAPAPSGPANSGSVSASFVAGATPRYLLNGVGSFRSGPATPFTQDASGAVLALGGNTLTGQTAVQQIGGDASFAMGRWVAGTVTTASGAETLTGTDNRAYHYVLYNPLVALPVTGSLTCDAGTFTAPTFDSGSSGAPTTGSATGQASLSFSADGASVTGSIAVSAGSGNGSVGLNASVTSPSSTVYTGAYFSNGAGSGVTVADGGAGAYQVLGNYRAKTADGTGYIGAYRFLCK